MCGFFISVNDSNIDFNNLLATIAHRGPDSSKTMSDSNWQFGFNRLSIVGNNEHDQPFRKSGSRQILCFNGEIYNFRQLAADFLRGKDNYTSDTEVFYDLLSQYGESILAEIDGIFAFVFFDPEKKRVIVARDEFGVKPLFYGFKNAQAYISSELQPINNLLNCSFDSSGLYEHLTFGHSLNGKTIYENIFEFSSGEYVIFDLDFKEIQRANIYEHNDLSSGDHVATIITDAINLQKPDIDYSILFSGGIDSTIIMKILGHDERCRDIISINVEHDEMSERYWQTQALDRYALESKYQCLAQSKSDFTLKNLEQNIKNLDQPISHPNFIGALEVAKFAKETGVKVLISGEGADEQFAGYKWFMDPSINNIEILSYLDRFKLADYFGINVADYDYINSISRNIFFKKIYLRKWLLRADLTGMKHSIEVRVPFLSRSLSELSQRMTFDQKTLSGKSAKAPLKHMLKKDLGSEYVNRRKIGFDYPLNDWVDNSHFEHLKKLDFLDAGDLNKLIAERDSDYRISRCIFVLAAFAIWKE